MKYFKELGKKVRKFQAPSLKKEFSMKEIILMEKSKDLVYHIGIKDSINIQVNGKMD